MTRSSRDPDAIDRIRDDAITTGVDAILQIQAARIASLESELKTMTSAADLLEAQKDAVGREFWRLREAVKARDGIIATLEAQLAAATERERGHLVLLRESADALSDILQLDEDEVHPEAQMVKDRLTAALAAAQEGATNE